MSEFSYDEVPYPSYTFPQTSPDRLATLATLFGMKPAPPRQCRVLEVGCGDGANLLSHAFMYRDSEFVGIDLSNVHVSGANTAKAELALSNVRFEQIDIMAFDVEKFGTFDYVIAHGVFSWVPAAVRDKLLRIYSTGLTPQGVGYISYNAYPGCHLRQIVWDMLRFHTKDELDPLAKVEKGRSLLDFICASMPPDSIYKEIMKHEAEGVAGRSIENILHDDLSSENQPFYLYEFEELAREKGLVYIADADPMGLGDGNLTRNISSSIDSLSGDPAIRRQYLDFIEFTRFRSSLVCREDASPASGPQVDAVSRLYIVSQVSPVSSEPDVIGEKSEAFRGPKGGSFESNHPLTKAVMLTLERAWPKPVSFDDLLEGSCKTLGNTVEDVEPFDVLRMQTFLLELYKYGFTKMHVHELEFAAALSERPEASSFARWQALRGGKAVMTMAGLNIELEFDVVRELLLLLDGTRRIDELTEVLASQLTAPLSEREAMLDHLPEMINQNLTKMAEWGLLVG